MRLEHNLAEMERDRESYWLRYPSTSPYKLKWPAVAVRHCFHGNRESHEYQLYLAVENIDHSRTRAKSP